MSWCLRRIFFVWGIIPELVPRGPTRAWVAYSRLWISSRLKRTLFRHRGPKSSERLSRDFGWKSPLTERCTRPEERGIGSCALSSLENPVYEARLNWCRAQVTRTVHWFEAYVKPEEEEDIVNGNPTTAQYFPKFHTQTYLATLWTHDEFKMWCL